MKDYKKIWEKMTNNKKHIFISGTGYNNLGDGIRVFDAKTDISELDGIEINYKDAVKMLKKEVSRSLMSGKIFTRITEI